jgi:hypothetical protein
MQSSQIQLCGEGEEKEFPVAELGLVQAHPHLCGMSLVKPFLKGQRAKNIL